MYRTTFKKQKKNVSRIVSYKYKMYSSAYTTYTLTTTIYTVCVILYYARSMYISISFVCIDFL